MTKQAMPKDAEREDRIMNEAVVDCYDEEERAMGWYYYLDGLLSFPFKARCIARRATSPLAVGEAVRVLRLADEEECQSEVMVEVEHGADALSVPLMQLSCLSRDEDTLRGVEDWHYWVARGYQY
ncbi:MAG: calcium-binding protein [Candidatus Accumulibacter sp.]|jgi:hypothetical protein|nr:calcium-binding protein [Accumulibacter sp.]